MWVDSPDLAVAVAALESFDGIDIVDEIPDQFLAFGDLVVGQGQANASTTLEVTAAGTLAAALDGDGVTVTLGGDPSVPWALGSEFGAGENIPRDILRESQEVQVDGWNQFLPWRGTGGDLGYFLHPAVRDIFDTSTDDPLMDALVELVGRRMDG